MSGAATTFAATILVILERLSTGTGRHTGRSKYHLGNLYCSRMLSRVALPGPETGCRTPAVQTGDVGLTVRVARWRNWRLPGLPITVIILFFLVAATGETIKAQDRADAVRAGNPVAESRFLSLILLSATAEPVLVEPTSRTIALPPLPTRIDRLLLLGQANSTVVVYDSLQQKVVYLPASSVNLHVTNCRSPETKQRTPAHDEACTRLQS